MTDASLPAGRFTQGGLRIGQVLSRAWSVFSGNFLKFSVITGIAALPSLLMPQPSVANAGNPFVNWPMFLLAFSLVIGLSMLSQAAVFYGAFQDMRRRPVSVIDGLKVGLNRFLPLLGIAAVFFLAAVAMAIVVGIVFAVFAVPGFRSTSLLVVVIPAIILLVVIPAIMLFLMWSMGTPVCVVERLGPFRSLGRSRELTKGHRWKVLGLLLVTMIPGVIISAVVGGVLGAILVFGSGGGVGAAVIRIVSLIWNAIWTAFFSIVIVVTYHDLRVAKEGVDTDQIAAVFE